MNENPTERLPPADEPEKRFAGSGPAVALAMVMMPLGVAAIVGGFVLHFAVKAGRVELSPYAGRLVILAGVLASIVAVSIAGRKAAVGFGAATLVVGVGMLVFGYVNMANPDLRFYAPLGFFVALAGGLFVWAGVELAKASREERDGGSNSPE